MVVKESSLNKYKAIFARNGVEFIALGKEEEDIERMVNILVNIKSSFLFPTDDKEQLYKYAKKLIDNGNNFVLNKEGEDMGVVSIYCNDFVTKTAYTSTIGIIPSQRGGRLITYIVSFALEFAKEVGMERYRAEVHKINAKWLNLLLKYNFQIEKETEDGTYMIVKDL